jgi:hypothetical protein
MAKARKENLEELAYEIGALFVNFGGFEHVLNLALAAALQLTVLQERSLVRGMMARQKIELLNSFAKRHWAQEAKEKLKVLVKDALELADFRNGIAHGMVTNDGEDHMTLITFRGEHRFDGNIHPLHAEEVAKYSQMAVRLAYEFQGLVDALDRATEQLRAGKPPQHPPK